MNVLFLDIDGVLNGYGTKDRIDKIVGSQLLPAYRGGE